MRPISFVRLVVTTTALVLASHTVRLSAQSNPRFRVTDHGTLSTEQDAVSIAHAINDLNPPTISGDSEIEIGGSTVITAFRDTLGQPLENLESIFGCSFARDNNSRSVINGFSEVTVGFSHPDPCACRLRRFWPSLFRKFWPLRGTEDPVIRWPAIFCATAVLGVASMAWTAIGLEAAASGYRQVSPSCVLRAGNLMSWLWQCSCENVVEWVKGSFFKQRRFCDVQDLEQQLTEWLQEVNSRRPSRATDTIPAERLGQEQERLRPPMVRPDELALRIPISVGVTGYVVHDTHPYSMPPEAAGLPGTLYLYRERVRIVAGRHQAEHPRLSGRHEQSTLPEHRAAQLAALSGKRGKRHLKRQHLFDTGEAAVQFLTESVHRNPRGWIRDVDQLHDLLQRHGPDAMHRAFRAAIDVGRFDVEYVGQCLRSCSSEPRLLFPSEMRA